MKINSAVVWVLVWYGLFLSLGLVLGDLPFLVWPYLFTFWLGWETYVGFGAAHLLGAAVAIGIAWWCERRKMPGIARLPALWSVLCIAIAVSVLMFVAWNSAMLMNRPTIP